MSLALTATAGTPAASPPGVLHVAPGRLTGLPSDAQVRTISEAATKAGPGDTVVIHGGVYRESVTIEKSGTKERPIRFRAAPGENVVITGADAIREWMKEPGGGNVFGAPWTHRFIGWNRSGTHPDDDDHKMIGRCEQVFILGYPLLQVLERGGLGAARSTSIWTPVGSRSPSRGANLAKERRSSRRPPVRTCGMSRASTSICEGLRFRYAANMAQQGATRFEGDHGVIEDCTFESTNPAAPRSPPRA